MKNKKDQKDQKTELKILKICKVCKKKKSKKTREDLDNMTLIGLDGGFEWRNCSCGSTLTLGYDVIPGDFNKTPKFPAGQPLFMSVFEKPKTFNKEK